MIKYISILGSTGSIGKNALQIARHLGPSAIRVAAIAAKSNIDLLEQQAKEFHPEIIGVYDLEKALELQRRLPHITIVGGMEGLQAVASYAKANLVISSIAGTLGLIPTLSALKSGKNVGLANKEALVSGGALVMSCARENNASIIPIDSEHSALFQCLHGENPATVQRLILTSSGGPFRTFTSDELQNVTVEQALKHPNWSMGPKVTIDSSTLMNKGLEVIEAHWLFNMPIEKIDVVIHPQSIIHSMVEYVDNSILAQMCEPTMIVPIQYAMTFPERKQGSLPKFDFVKNGTLQFFMPDSSKFRCLGLAYQAVKEGGTLPCYMNAANEVLVERFINREISWNHIAEKLETLMSKHRKEKITSLDTILDADRQARREASSS